MTKPWQIATYTLTICGLAFIITSFCVDLMFILALFLGVHPAMIVGTFAIIILWFIIYLQECIKRKGRF